MSSAASTASSVHNNHIADGDYVMLKHDEEKNKADCSQKKTSVWELEDDDVEMTPADTEGKKTEAKRKSHSHVMVVREASVQDADFDAASVSASCVTVVPVKENGGRGKMNLSVDKLECMKCKVVLQRRSDFLLMNEKEDWCQTLWGWCQSCSELPQKEFNKQQRKQWIRRQREATGIGRKRGMDFGQLMEELAERFPGSDKRSLLTTARLRVKALGQAAALAAFGAEAKTKERYENACRAYFDSVRAVAEEAVEQAEDDDTSHSHVMASESEAVKPASASKSDIRIRRDQFLSEEADFLTMVTTSISVSYACKGRDCRFYGMNDQWFQKKDGGYRFRCPNCSKLYKPWKVTETTDFSYAKVICVVNPANGEKMIFPAQWPSSKEDNWLQEMMTATAHDAEAASHRQVMTARESLLALDKMLKAIGVPGDGRFVHYNVKQWVIDALKPTTDFGDESVWRGHVEKGFYGNILPIEVASQPAFDEWPTFIALFANLLQADNKDEVMSLNLDGLG